MNIDEYSPCKDGLEYYRSQPDFATAWKNCHRGDWMLWIAKKLNVDNRILTLAKGKCAETVLCLMKDQRSIDAVKSAIDFGNGLIDESQLNAYAYDAADTSYDTAYDTDAAYGAAREENQLKTANICREILTEAVMKKVKEQV